MSKHEELGTQEAAEYRPHSEILRYITDDKDVDETTSKDFRVLDWGCGYGRCRLVGHLLIKGIEAYGADIDPEIIKNGKNYFVEAGIDSEKHLYLINAENCTICPDGFFDIII